MKNCTFCGGGEFSYSAPLIVMTEVSVEAGFAASANSNGLDPLHVLDEVTWDE